MSIADKKSRRDNEPPKMIEYEPEIVTTFGTYKQKDIGKIKVKHNPPYQSETIVKNCPFLKTTCVDLCALYDNRTCHYAARKPATKSGKICPFCGTAMRRLCNDSCMMYDNGNCKIIK